MNLIHLKKGYDLNVEGRPSNKIVKLPKPAHVAALPEKIPFIKPRLLVEMGDEVKIGTVLFVDKRNPKIKFLSPGGGRVEQINFGPRRIIREIIIKTESEEASEAFEQVSTSQLEQMKRRHLVEILMDGGLWPLIRQLPYRDIADPEKIPPAVYVSLDAGEPFQPASGVYLGGQKELFAYGLRILRKLAQDNVYITARHHDREVPAEYNQWVTHFYVGKYPAADPGVLLYHTRTSPDANRSWYINGQDLLLLARLLKTGKYPVERIVALGGTLVADPGHVRTRWGVPLAHLAGKQKNTENIRYIAGGLFRGYVAAQNTFLGYYETSLLLLPEGDQEEVLGFVRPGFNKPSYSRAFLSYFNTAALPVDCNRHGGVRACIACGYCARVCPVDILPQLTFKAVLADAVEEFLAHGLLDCVECGLCTYVCPSKIELADILAHAKAAYYKEQTA